MKRNQKLILGCLLAVLMALAPMPAKAQDDTNLFNHLGVAVSLGTDGIGFDVAMPATDWAALRAGVSFFPAVKVKSDFKIDDNNPAIADRIDLEAKVKFFNAKVLADVYPIPNSSFHITAGAYIGKDEIATITNTSMFIKDPAKYGKLGLKVGDYRITTDKDGYIDASLKVNSFKPYVGIGFGRAVPRKSRVSVSCDLGVMFWGKPGLSAMTIDDWGNKTRHTFSSDDFGLGDSEDFKDAVEKSEKLTVWPVLNIRLSGRIF